jgi:hypothetical protein
MAVDACHVYLIINSTLLPTTIPGHQCGPTPESRKLATTILLKEVMGVEGVVAAWYWKEIQKVIPLMAGENRGLFTFLLDQS